MKFLTLFLCVSQIVLGLGTPNRGKKSHEDFLEAHEELTDFIDEMADLKIGERRYGGHGHFQHSFQHEASPHCEHPRDVNCKMDVTQDCKDPNGCVDKVDPEPEHVPEEEEVKDDKPKNVVEDVHWTAKGNFIIVKLNQIL